MVEVATRRAKKCKECKRRQAYYDRGKIASVDPLGREVVLGANGLCVDCAPVALNCSRGKRCEFDRIMNWNGNHGGSNSFIPELRLCDHHDAIRTARLGRAS